MEKQQAPIGLNETMKNIASGVMGIYVFLMFAVFPFYNTDMYFDMMKDRTRFLTVITIAAAIIMLVLGLVFLFVDKKEYSGMYFDEFRAGFSKENLKKKFSLTDLFFALLLLIMIISTLCSEYPYESFWGNRGRNQGLYMWILYAVMYLMITRYFRPKRWYLDLFLAVGTLICLWGITDFFKMNLFGYLTNVAERNRYTFVSSVGNINSYTSMTAVVLGASVIQFSIEKQSLRQGLYALAVIVSAFACVMGISDNVVFAFMAILGFAPFYLFKDRRGVLGYLISAAVIFSAMTITGMIVDSGVDSITENTGGSFLISLGGSMAGILLMIFSWALVLGFVVFCKSKAGNNLSGFLDQKSPEVFRKGWMILFIVVAVILLYIIMDANSGKHPERWDAYANAIVFNDDWGTHRGHNWRLAIEQFSEFSPFKKLFGYGPDTYYIITTKHYNAEMISKYGEIYDSAHNEYLQYMMTSGVLGMLAYIGLIASGCGSMLKNAKKNPLCAVVAFAVITYAAQAIVNIAVPIVLPLVLVLYFVGIAMTERKEL